MLGKPDTKEWRNGFDKNRVIPVAKNGNISPHQALLDLYKLIATTPGIEKQILRGDIALSDLPSLEETVAALSRTRLK